jgi:hypothetical protein
MERNNHERGPDTGKIELKRILNCLKENGYAFEDIEESNHYGFMVANFEKDIQYSDVKGNYINDRHIKIQIEFDSDFDYKTSYKDRNDDFLFDNSKGERFIQKLLHDDTSSSSNRSSSNRSSSNRSSSNRSSSNRSSSNRSRTSSRSSGGTRKRLIKRKK